MPISMFPAMDPHGDQKLTPRSMGKRERERLTRRRLHAFHKQKNGAYDPVTYYHVLEQLMHIEPGKVFKTKEFVNYLIHNVEGMLWDAVTVGRVIADIAEAVNEVYGFIIIGHNRRFDGMWFDMTSDPQGRAALKRLLEDLWVLVEEELEAEKKGVFPKRFRSPLEKCPSVTLHDVRPVVREASVYSEIEAQ